MLFVNFLKKNAEAGQAFFKKLLLVCHIHVFEITLDVWSDRRSHGRHCSFKANSTCILFHT